MTRQISKRLSEYLASEHSPADTREAAAAMKALPLFSDMGGCIGIKPDGAFMHYDWETKTIVDENGPVWQLLAMVAGSKKYPELRSLLPEKTEDAEQCSLCKGAGCLVVENQGCNNIVCGKCFGLGWVTEDIVSLSQLLGVDELMSSDDLGAR